MKNGLLKKLDEIKSLLQGGEDKILILGLSLLLTIALGLFVIIDKLTDLIKKVGALVEKAQVEHRVAEDSAILKAIEQKLGSFSRITGADAIAEAFTPVHARNTSVGSGLSVVLDTGGRPFVEVWVESSGAAEFNVFGSFDSQIWKQVDTIVLSSAGTKNVGYLNANKLVKVETSAQNVNTIDISASR